MNMQNCNVPSWFLRIVGFVRPSIDSRCFRMPVQIKNLNDSFPYRLALKRLFDWHTLNVRSFCAVQLADYVLQFLDVPHYSFLSSFLWRPLYAR